MNFDRNRILDSILDHIGGTPMVRINRIGVEEGLECELVAKLEFFNAGGSVKDRIGKRMMLKGIEEGHVTAGTTGMCFYFECVGLHSHHFEFDWVF